MRKVLPKPTMITDFRWEDPFKGWAHKWVERHFWRVRYYFLDKEDAMQECALIFTRVANKYRGKIDNYAWFMRLFQASISNAWINYSAYDHKYRVTDDLPEDILIDSPAPLTRHAMYGFASEASGDVFKVLKLMACAPCDVLDALLDTSDMVVLNRRLKRWSGIGNTKLDIVSELRDYIIQVEASA